MATDNYRNITKKTFDDIADDYIKRDEGVVDETFEVKAALEQFLKLLPSQGKVLDIGSGGGRDSKFLFKHGLKVIGVDFSEKMVEKAKKIQPEIDYRVMDLEELDFLSEEFDGVWANASLHHIPKSHLPLVLKKIHQILKKDGVFFVKVKHGKYEGIRENEKFGRIIKRYFSYYEPEELTESLKSAGFAILKVNLTTAGEWIDIFAEKI